MNTWVIIGALLFYTAVVFFFGYSAGAADSAELFIKHQKKKK